MRGYEGKRKREREKGGWSAKNKFRPILIRNRSFLLSNERGAEAARVRACSRNNAHVHAATIAGRGWVRGGGGRGSGADCVSPNQYH